MAGEVRGENPMTVGKIPERSHHSQHGKGYWLPRLENLVTLLVGTSALMLQIERSGLLLRLHQHSC